MNNLQGILFMVVGPPGAGKNTLMNQMIEQNDHLSQLATATTRARRATEREGREHLFVTTDQFRQMIAENALLEWQEVHPGTFYGVPRQSVETALVAGQYLIADIDVLGATYIRSCYPENVVMIFVEPPEVDTLAERMRQRGETEASISKRMKRVAMELLYVPLADYVVVNDDLEAAGREFQSIIVAEIARHSTGRLPSKRYTHHAVAIPVYEDEVLCPPHSLRDPIVEVADQQAPHQAALKSLSQTLGLSPSTGNLLRLKPNQGSFISPIGVDTHQEGKTRHITFTYIYLLPNRIEPGNGWHWQSIDDIDLPDHVRQLLEQRRQTSP